METKTKTEVNETSKYPTWKKVGFVVAGVVAAAGIGYMANKFGWLPKSKVVLKTIEKSVPKAVITVTKDTVKHVGNNIVK